MAVDPIDAVSGLNTGDTGAEKSNGLNDAMDKAWQSVEETDVPDQVVKAKIERDPATKTADKTTDETTKDAPAKTSTESPDQQAAPTGDAVLDAPKHWPAERKQAFAGLAPDAQKALLTLSKDLEGGFTRKSMELSDTVKYADSMRGLFSDDRTKHQLSQAGLDEVGYVRYLHSLQNFATSDAPKYIAWAMQNLGVTPQQLGFGAQGQAPQQQQQDGTGDPRLDELLMDPALKQLRDEFGQQRQTVQQLQQRLEAQDRAQRDYTTQQQQTAQRSLVNLWNEFRGSIDDHGQLAHPHADVLMQQMGAIMETDPEIAPMADGPDKLKAAYEAATWARPALRTSRLESERAQAAVAASRKAEAEKAKRSAGPKRASGAPGVPVRKSGLDGALDAAFAALGRD